MDIMTCPHCRRKADRPLFLPRGQQQVFDFIWNNPDCSIKEIEEAFYGSNITSNLITVQISKARDNLTGTPFKLHSYPDPTYNGPGKTAKRYKIVEAT